MRLFRSHDGAAAVEMALLLPLLAMLAFGIIEFSTAYNRYQGMQAAAREGSRFAATSTSFSPITADQIAIRARNALQDDAAGAGFPAPGGSAGGAAAQIVADVDVTVTNVGYDGSVDVLGATDTACLPDSAVRSVIVELEITTQGDRRLDYGIDFPWLPGSPYGFGLEAEGTFDCSG